MVNLLSMIVCIAMLFTGGYAAEDPNAVSSLVTTISDVVVTIDGTEYPLNPSIVLGVSTNGTDSALFDFSVPMGDDVLFPVQAKADDSGVSVILGDSSTAHTFSTDYITEAMGLDELTDEFSEFFGVYGELITSLQSVAANSDSYDQTMIDAINAKVNELLGDVPAEEATFTIDGQELTGEHFALTLDNDQVCEIVDASLDQIPGFSDAYFDLLNTMMAEMGEDAEFHSYADLLAYTGMEMTLDIDMTGNDTSAMGDLVYHITIDESKMSGYEAPEADDGSTAEIAEPVVITMDLPLSVIVHDENNVEMYMSFSEENVSGVEIDEDMGMGLAMSASKTGDDSYVSFAMSVDDGYEPVQFGYTITTSADEDGSTETTVLFAFSVDQDSITFTMDSAAQPDGSSLSSIDISASGEMFDSEALSSLGLSFSVETEPVEIEDRIAAAASTEVYNTDEDVENASSLMMSVMGMASDLEKLQNEESVAALLSAVYDLTGSDVVVIDDDYDDDNYGDDDGDPAALPFAMPEFTWLPEGYELDDSYISAEYGYASLYFEYTGDDDEYHSTLYVDLSEASSSNSVNYTLSGESLVEPVITIEREDGCIDALAILNGVEVSVTYYDDDLTDEDILSFFAGIVTE
ncbi:MAG: hypothetical protein ACI4MF_08040 [Candidatus Faecivicinus sp.]